MPDHENTMVIKCAAIAEDDADGIAGGAIGASANEDHEFVIQTPDAEEMRRWLTLLLACMRWPINSTTLACVRETRCTHTSEPQSTW